MVILRVHAAIPLICRTGAGSSDPKNGLASKNGGQSSVVTRMGHFSNRFLNNLRLIVDISD